MSLNDKDVSLAGNRGVDVHPGIANPTVSSTHADPLAANFVTDPTTNTLGAGAGKNFSGDKEAARNFSKTAGVIEGRPGIIESTNIDPLNEDSNKDDGWANAKSTPSSGAGIGSSLPSVGGAANTAYNAAASVATTAMNTASSAANAAYSLVADPKTRQSGKESTGDPTKW